MLPLAPLDHNTAKSLLRPSGQHLPYQEEDRRAWALEDRSLFSNEHFFDPFLVEPGIYEELRTKPLLRVWDSFSGSIPNRSCGNRMLARLPRGELATFDTRKTSLARHANQRNQIHTPYISFTSSVDAAVRLANERKRPRGDQHIVVVDPWYRLQRGLPVLDMGKEMREYGVQNPYGEDYYTDHYLCLWEITPEEVIGTWSCNYLRQVDGWYENIIMQEFRKHRAAQ